MVEDELRVGAHPHEPRGIRQLVGGDAQVEREAMPRRLLHATDERGVKTEAGLVPLNVVPHADDPIAPRQCVERIRATGVVTHVHVRHDADNARLRARRRLDELRFPQALGRQAVGLDEHHGVNRPCGE